MKTTFLTNVNPLRTSELIHLLGELEQTRPLLTTYTDLIIIERNPSYLEQMICALFEPLKISCNGQRIDESEEGINNLNFLNAHKVRYSIPKTEVHTLLEITGRVKGTNSIAEKISRLQSNPEYQGITHLTLQDQIAAADIYALTIVTRTLQQCYAYKERILTHPEFVLDEPEKDYIANPKPSGYKAIHQYLRWNNADPALQHLCLEIHYETIETHLQNTFGVNSQTQCAHNNYTKSKLTKNHQMGNSKIIIIDHEGTPNLELKRWQVHNVDLSLFLQGECNYHLVQGR